MNQDNRPKRCGRKLYGYTRASDPRKQEKSPEVQADLLGARAKEMGEEITKIFNDGISGSKVPFADRPAARALEDVLEPGDGVIVWKLDRFGRKTRDILGVLSRFCEQGIDIYVLDHGNLRLDLTSAVGKILVTILAGFAEFEANLISERTREAIAWRRKNGLPCNGWPRYGYRLCHRPRKPGQKKPEAYLVRDEREMAIIGEAYHRRYVKGEQLRTIWQDFKKRGERTTRGTLWTENRLYRAIRQWKERLETGEPF